MHEQCIEAFDPAITKYLHSGTALKMRVRFDTGDTWRRMHEQPAYFSAVMECLASTKAWSSIRYELSRTMRDSMNETSDVVGDGIYLG